MESFGSLSPKLFNGRAMATIRADYRKGKMEITVFSDGLKGAKAQVKSE
jgi:beta-galactosidase